MKLTLKPMMLRLTNTVDLRGIKPEMQEVSQIVLKAFNAEGFDCWLTSAVRPEDDDSLHGYGFAQDYDSSSDVPKNAGMRIRSQVQGALGSQFDVLWHKTENDLYHLHVEFDPGGKGVAPYRRVA